jgi:Cu+-exporting ATPase
MIKIAHISGMTCGHCKMKVEKELTELQGVDKVEVDLLEGTAEIELSDEISSDLLSNTLKNAGYTLISINE